MKKTVKNAMTALIFSVAVLGCGAISMSCGRNGTPNATESDTSETGISAAETQAESKAETDTTTAAIDTAEPIDFSALTEDEILNFSDAQFIAFAQQVEKQVPSPSYSAFRPAGGYSIAERSAADDTEADAIAAELYEISQLEYHTEGYPQFLEEKVGFWRYYDFGPHLGNILVTDKAFLDMETMALNAEVNEDNMLRLAALYNQLANEIGAFVHDTGDALTCTEYAVQIAVGDYGMSDTAILTAHTFSVEKATGKLCDFYAEEEILRSAEIPDSRHSEAK